MVRYATRSLAMMTWALLLLLLAAIGEVAVGKEYTDGNFTKCCHGVWDATYDRCVCNRGWKVAGPTDTFAFLQGECAQSTCTSDSQCLAEKPWAEVNKTTGDTSSCTVHCARKERCSHTFAIQVVVFNNVLEPTCECSCDVNDCHLRSLCRFAAWDISLDMGSPFLFLQPSHCFQYSTAFLSS